MLLGNSSNSGQISLGVRFYLNDQFSKPVKNMQDAIRGYKQEFTAFQENLRAARNVALAVAGAGMLATRGMYAAAMEGAEFLYVMKGVEAITEATNEQMANLQQLALQLGRETMFMPEQIASGMRFMAMAGQDALTIQQTMSAATNLAGATMTALGGKMGAADIMTNALKAFGWEAGRSSQMSDILTAATTNANVSLVDLGNSIRYVSATSRNLKIPVQETVGLLMSLGNAGIQSSMAGTALENMYRYLARSLTGNASKKAKEAWSEMGLSRSDVTTAEGRFKPMVEILGMMNKAMEGMDPIATQAIFRNIFGVRGVRGAATIARNLEQAGGFVKMLSDESNIGGTAAKKMAIMMDSLLGVSNQLESTWKGLKVAWADATGNALIPLMKVLKSVLGYITDLIKTPTGSFVAQAIFGLTVLTTVFFGLKAAILSVAYAMKTLTVSVGGMRAASSIAMGFMGLGGYNLKSKGSMLASSYSRTGAMPTNYVGTHAPMNPRARAYKGARGGTRWVGSRGAVSSRSMIPTGPLVLATTKTTKAITGLRGIMAGVARGGAGLLGILGGPVGIGIMALTIIGPFLPRIWDALTSNTDAIEENTRRIANKDKPISPELFAMIQGRTVEDLLGSMIEHMQEALEQGLVTQEAIITMMEKADPTDILQYVYSETGVKVKPDFSTQNPFNSE